MVMRLRVVREASQQLCVGCGVARAAITVTIGIVTQRVCDACRLALAALLRVEGG